MAANNQIRKAEVVGPRGRRTEITIETRTTTIIRTSGGGLRMSFCEQCGADTTVLSVQQAALIFQLSESELELFRNTGEIHSAEEESLCARSVAEHLRREIRYVED